jgi:hypothetical protein
MMTSAVWQLFPSRRIGGQGRKPDGEGCALSPPDHKVVDLSALAC